MLPTARKSAAAVWNYAHGTQGVILSRDPNLARQHPADYVKGAEITIKQALAAAKKTVRGFSAEQVVGIGVDTTGSTPLPVDANGQPLAFQQEIRQQSGRDGLAVERPHRRGRGGGNHRARARKSARNISPNAAAPIPANGSSARFCTACAPRRKCSTPRIPGLNWRISFPPR